MKVIGLTGGIGSGKSTVSNYLIQQGYHVLDADLIAREIVLPGSETLIQIVSEFGEEYLSQDGSLNRKKLAELIFRDETKKLRLNAIMHDKITEIILQRILQFKEESNILRSKKIPGLEQKRNVIFIDAPLLFEVGLDRSVSEVWVVDTEEEVRIQRIKARDDLDQEEIKRRILAQMDREESLKRASHVLDNSGDRDKLYRQINSLLEQIPMEQEGKR